jgi:hypothetical protein
MADRCGTYSHEEFGELCSEFFEAEELGPISPSVFRPALERLSNDITKTRSDRRYRGKKGASRKRSWRWTVLDAETEANDIPWPELPSRKVA